MKRRFLLGGQYLELNGGTVSFNGKKLRPAQTNFLRPLLEKPGETIPYKELYLAYNPKYDNSVDPCLIHRMKNRLDPEIRRAIFVDRGIGLYFDAPIDLEFEQKVVQDEQGVMNKKAFEDLDSKKNVFFSTRQYTDEALNLRVRFGKDLAEWACISDNRPFSGYQPIERLTVIGFSGTSLFQRTEYFDQGQKNQYTASRLRPILQTLLYREDCDIRILLSKPGKDKKGTGSRVAEDAIAYKKLANDQFVENGNAIFTAFTSLTKEKRTVGSPIYRAFETGRVKLFLSEMVLPYSLLLIEYKQEARGIGFKNHMKIDWYVPLKESKARPSMFLTEDHELYEFFRLQAKELMTGDFAEDIQSVSNADLQAWEEMWKDRSESKKEDNRQTPKRK